MDWIVEQLFGGGLGYELGRGAGTSTESLKFLTIFLATEMKTGTAPVSSSTGVFFL